MAAIISHWHQPFEDTKLSSQDFYRTLFDAIKGCAFPNVVMEKKIHLEGTLLSPGREYLRIRRDEYTFDVCAAPFGTNFFISYWLSEEQGCGVALVRAIPFIGKGWARLISQKTFYQQDTEIMFKESIRAVLMEVIAKLADEGKGLRKLSPEDSKPQFDSVSLLEK